jgi:heat shock protein HslJ
MGKILLFAVILINRICFSQSLPGSTWVLKSIDNLETYKSTVVPEKIVVTLTFISDSTYGGKICNRYSGRYKFNQEKKIAMSHPVSTRMYCLGVDAIEKEVLTAFTTAFKYKLEEGKLFLFTTDDKRLLFTKQ